MTTIETSAEWWRAVEQNWDDIVVLFKGCALEAQLSEAERLKRSRDAQIARRLQAVRRRAPRRACRGDHSWQVLFDLCAEQWVLHQPVA